jgi:hypothetical protein
VGRSRAVLDQDPPPPVDEVKEERQFNHLQTNILALEKLSHPGRHRRPATHRETDLARSEERREDQVADIKERTTHIAITSEMPP